MKDTPWCTKIYDARCNIERELNELMRMSRAYETLLQYDMADKLRAIVESVMVDLTAISEATAQKLDDSLKDAKANSAAVLASALAGIELSTRKNK